MSVHNQHRHHFVASLILVAILAIDAVAVAELSIGEVLCVDSYNLSLLSLYR